ncbi:MAG: ADP-ribosylglycohydrolase family protein [Tetrasphaera sp.]|nr:ADP-ribosylglycohydrolase family protein [Tetrasphaera sp.]
MSLEVDLLDRARGVLVGQAVGDALGVPYEFGCRALDPVPAMLGGGLGGFAPGQWSDDTAMALCIAEVAATGTDLAAPAALDAIALGFELWFSSEPPDVGVQTRSVLVDAAGRAGSPAQRLGSAARALHERTGRTAGNGSLMRTAVVALPGLCGPAAPTGEAAVVAAARAVSDLTHADPLAADACALWSVAVRRAVLGAAAAHDLPGLFDCSVVPQARRGQWEGRLQGALAAQHPSDFPDNGYVVTALQACVCALARAPRREGSGFFVDAVTLAVHAGHDTDSVAAITGALAGALVGRSAIPLEWASAVHGWPGLRAADLDRLTVNTLGGGLLGSGPQQPAT